MTFGGDFLYEDALSNFKNLDKLIKYVNAEVYMGVASHRIRYFKFSSLAMKGDHLA
jgi:hypothetical protein